MPFSSWLWRFVVPGSVISSRRPRRGRLPAAIARGRLLLERLEDRTLLTVTWINPAGGDWDTAANWQDDQGSHRLPVSTDDVLINTAGITVVHASAPANDEIRSLTS